MLAQHSVSASWFKSEFSRRACRRDQGTGSKVTVLTFMDTRAHETPNLKTHLCWDRGRHRRFACGPGKGGRQAAREAKQS